MRRVALALAAILLGAAPAVRSSPQGPTIAVLDAGCAPENLQLLRAQLNVLAGLRPLDSGLANAAAHGAGYTGGTNLSTTDARRIALTAGATALVFVRRVSEQNDGPCVGEPAALALFFVDGRTGRLLRFAIVPEVLATENGDSTGLARELAGWPELLRHAESDRDCRPPSSGAGVVDVVAGESPAGLHPPRFFRRPAPEITPQAARFGVTATVDLAVEFNADGTLGLIEVLRWAGFGLDEEAVRAVRARQFAPGRVAERVVTVRALLRYNFRVRDR